MPYITAASGMLYRTFSDAELDFFNDFKVSMIPSEEVKAYHFVEESEGEQSAKRVKIDESEGLRLTRLPEHVCLSIFDYLEPKDIVRVVSASKGWGVDFLKALPQYYIVLNGIAAQQTFYNLLGARKNTFFKIRSIHHSASLRYNDVVKLLLSQSQFVDLVKINTFQYCLKSVMQYFAYEKASLNNKLLISEVVISQNPEPRQQMIAVKVLEALLAGSAMMKKLTFDGLIMQMPYGFSFFQDKHFPVLESLNLAKSNIRIEHLHPLLRATPRLKELNLRGCDRLKTGDFKGLQDIHLPFLVMLDISETDLREPDLLAWQRIAPKLKSDL